MPQGVRRCPGGAISDAAGHLPGPRERWRCVLCGNVTRFDVVRTVRAREYVHVSLDGTPQIQERDVLAETVERLSCRWCARSDTVAVEERPGARGPSA